MQWKYTFQVCFPKCIVNTSHLFPFILSKEKEMLKIHSNFRNWLLLTLFLNGNLVKKKKIERPCPCVNQIFRCLFYQRQTLFITSFKKLGGFSSFSVRVSESLARQNGETNINILLHLSYMQIVFHKYQISCKNKS